MMRSTSPPAARSIVAALILVAGGLLAGCAGPFGAVRASDTLDLAVDIQAGTPVRVETFNGAIDVTTSADPRASAIVTRTGEGDTQAEARADCDMIDVTFRMVEGTAVLRAVYTPSPTNINGSRGAAVSIRVPKGTALELVTSNGGVSVRDTWAPVAAHTSNGSVDLRGVTGALAVETSNEAITIEADQARADLHTSNAAVTFIGSLVPGSHRVETSNGAVDLRLPEGSCFTIDAETSNNAISSDFEVAGSSTERSLQGTAGEAGPDGMVAIHARTSNGPIAIHKT